jgi:hypothetical protein
MKKVLLIAVAAFVASFAKAQAPGQGKLVKAPSAPIVTIGAMKSMANREIKPVQSVLMNGPVKSRLAKPYKLSAKEQASLKPVYRLNSNTTRRAGELQSKYNGKGSNFQTKEAASWVMQTAVNEGTTYLINVIPLPEDWASLEYIAVPASGYEFVKWLFNGEDFSGNTNRQISWGYDPAEHADGTLTAVFQEETETEYTLRMMVSEGYIRAHATLYVKIGNNAEVAYTFASAEDMQNITVPEGSSVRLRVEWDDLFYPATFLGWLNDYTSQAESTSNPYTFTMSANKYITCNLRSDSN